MNKKIIYLIILIFLGLFSNEVILAQSTSAANQEGLLTGGGKCLEIPLPFIDQCPSTPADYLSGLYRLALSIGVIAAVAMVIISGIKYATSGDNASKQKEARGQIMDAVIGLVILFASVLILRTINPDLVNLGNWLPPTGVPEMEYNWSAYEFTEEQIEKSKKKCEDCIKYCNSSYSEDSFAKRAADAESGFMPVDISGNKTGEEYFNKQLKECLDYCNSSPKYCNNQANKTSETNNMQ